MDIRLNCVMSDQVKKYIILYFLKIKIKPFFYALGCSAFEHEVRLA